MHAEDIMMCRMPVPCKLATCLVVFVYFLFPNERPWHTYPTQDAWLPLSVWALTAHAKEVLQAQDGFLWTHGTNQLGTLTTVHGEVPPLEGWARMWAHPSAGEVCFTLSHRRAAVHLMLYHYDAL